MAQALCENDHPLQAGESRCPRCGERIRMQWMSPRSFDPMQARPARPVGDESPRKPPLLLVTVLFIVALAGQVLRWPEHHWWTPLVIAALVLGYAGVLWDRWRSVRARRDGRAALVE